MESHDRDDVVGARPAPPPPPPGAPSDWSSVVHYSSWYDIQRLGLWTAGQTPIASGQDPSSSFAAVSPRTLGGGATPPTIYVVVHGWAPGFRSVVDQARGDIRWWSSGAHVSGRWASDWCWAPVVGPKSGSGPGIVVNPTGVAQQIAAHDSAATILAYSWIDDSATESGTLNLTEVYRSEAYTHLNGIRLANALQEAIVPSFFANGGQIHLIGHSHGSRVCTVAALSLQDRGYPTTQLTILDSPETTAPLGANGANLLGYYLDRLDVRDPSVPGRGTLVDSYSSYFGVTYDSANASSPVKNVVDVALAPSHIYGSLDPSDCHTYAAAWYGAAAASARAAGRPPVGLDWPPVPNPHTPALDQLWRGPGQDQWTLTAGPSRAPTYRYATYPLPVATTGTHGGVTVAGGVISFRAAGGDPYSIFHGRYAAQHWDQYGIAFDLSWSSPRPGELFVVSIGHVGGGFTYTLLVLDGASIAPWPTTSIAINSDTWAASHAAISMYFLGDPSNNGDVRVANLRYVEVS